jgi:plastocyanin
MKNITILASISGVLLASVMAQPVFAENNVIIPKASRDCENSDSCFVPSILEIKQGQTAVWENNDSTIHSLVGGSKDSGSSGNFQSGIMMPGGTYSFTLTSSGIFPYYCEIHPWMKGVIWSK